jgi:long-chain fatty acid transport protein
MRTALALPTRSAFAGAASILLLAAAGAPVQASGFLIFQHGGRGTGQAGAFTARADDPSAMSYNPAALVHLDGVQAQVGLDFTTPSDTYESDAGSFDTNHEINFPPHAYLTWKPARDGRWAFGVGIDEPLFDNVSWAPKEFPGRFLTRRQEHQISELHLVSAYDLGAGWSVALGARWAYGRIKDGRNAIQALPAPRNAQEVELSTTASVTGWGADASVQYKTDVWGFGAVLKSAEKVSGHGDTTLAVRPDNQPPLPPGQGIFLDSGGRKLSFEMPMQAIGGVWFAPYPELRIELDAALAQWSGTNNTYAYFPGGIAAANLTLKDRDWKDTLSLRLGVEGDITDAVMIYGGISLEPTPVPSSRLEPGFARGDATVYALGASYSFPHISFDLGWSLHTMSNRNASGQELRDPLETGRYNSNDQAFGFSVRWRLGS